MSLELLQGGKSRRTPEHSSPPPISPEMRRESIKKSGDLAWKKRHEERLRAKRAEHEEVAKARDAEHVRALQRQLGPSKQELAHQTEAQEEAQTEADAYFDLTEARSGKRDKKLEAKIETAKDRMEIAIDKEMTASLSADIVAARTTRAVEIRQLESKIQYIASLEAHLEKKEKNGEPLTSSEKNAKKNHQARREGYADDIKIWEEARQKEQALYQDFHHVRHQMEKLADLVKTEYGTTIEQLQKASNWEAEAKAQQGVFGKIWGGIKSMFRKDVVMPGTNELKQWEKLESEAAALKQDLFELPRAAKKEVRGMGRIRMPDLTDRSAPAGADGLLFDGESRAEKKSRKIEAKEAKIQLERDISNEHAELLWGKEGTIDAKTKAIAKQEGLTYEQAAEIFMADGEEKFKEALESMKESQALVDRIREAVKNESPEMPKYKTQLETVEKTLESEFADNEAFRMTKTYNNLLEDIRTAHREIDAMQKRRTEGAVAGEKFMELKDLQDAAEEAMEKYLKGKMSDAEIAKEARVLSLKTGALRKKFNLPAEDPLFKKLRAAISDLWVAKEKRAKAEQSDRLAA